MSRPSISALLDELAPGRSVYLPGATGESLALRAALAADPERAAGVRFVSCLVPGMNDFDYAALSPTTSFTTFLMPPAMRASLEAGRVRLLPLAYSEIAEQLATRAQIDVGIFHLAPPDADGLCSVGVAAETSRRWSGPGQAADRPDQPGHADPAAGAEAAAEPGRPGDPTSTAR